MPSTTRAKLIATARSWLESRKYNKASRLVDRFILAYELETDLQPLAKKLLRCNQTDVDAAFELRTMLPGEAATLHQERADQTQAADPLDLASGVKAWPHAANAAIAAAAHASAQGAEATYSQIRLGH